jgi:hypothetical protein
MNNAEVDFCPARKEKPPLGQNAPVPRAEERRFRQCLDPVTAVDILVRVSAEHDNVDIGVTPRRSSRAAANKRYGSNVLPTFGKTHKGHEEPLDVFGDVRGHDAIIARGCSFEANGAAPRSLSSFTLCDGPPGARFRGQPAAPRRPLDSERRLDQATASGWFRLGAAVSTCALARRPFRSSGGRPARRAHPGDERSLTIAVVAAATGELLGEQTVQVGRRGFGAVGGGLPSAARLGSHPTPAVRPVLLL